MNPIAVIGAGPAGLAAAEVVAASGLPVVVFEQMPSPGRKLLMAGLGGLNITHSEPADSFIARYTDRAPALRPMIEAFTPQGSAEGATWPRAPIGASARRSARRDAKARAA